MNSNFGIELNDDAAQMVAGGGSVYIDVYKRDNSKVYSEFGVLAAGLVYGNLADDIAQAIDGGMSCVDIKTAIDRWKANNPYSTSRHWKLSVLPGEAIEVSPAPNPPLGFQMQHMASNGGEVSAMAMGNETAIGTHVYEDSQGRMVHTASSYSAS